MTEESIIIEQIQKGIDVHKGFRKLVIKYQEQLYWHIRSMVKTHDDANDVLQNCFIKAYKNINKFKGNSRFYTWIYRIATNECLNFISKQKRSGTMSIVENEQQINNMKAEVEIDGENAQQILLKAIESLPDKQKLVFNMRYFDEMKYSDISEILSTSEGALKASYHHAIKKIEAFVKSLTYE